MNGPNMSYCMYENTNAALKQILDDLRDAVDNNVSAQEYKDNLSSEYELQAFKQFRKLCESVLVELDSL